MFFVVNKTKNTIIISDIGVTLGPRQAIDLDKIMSRSKSDGSKLLKLATKKGEIDIRIKDGGKTSNKDIPKEESSLDITEMKEMLEEMKELLSKQKSPSTQVGLSKKDLAEFAQQIIQNIPKQEIVVAQGQSQNNSTDEDVAMDEDVLANISARAVNNIVKGTEANELNCKEETQENTILDNISELENLI